METAILGFWFREWKKWKLLIRPSGLGNGKDKMESATASAISVLGNLKGLL